MTNKLDNVQEMIVAFTGWKESSDVSSETCDDLIRYLLDRSVVPTYQTRAWGEDVIDEDGYHDTEYTIIKTEPTTDLEKDEILEVQKLINTKDLYRTPEDLITLLTTYPPILLEQALVLGMVMYMLRYSDADINAETEAFNEFYHGWSSLVCRD